MATKQHCWIGNFKRQLYSVVKEIFMDVILTEIFIKLARTRI